jgi:pimeloyl-ACP methyl ester carboxylesterase
VTATPIWFGPDDRLLFGWFHCPGEARARGGVVLCNPLGIDALRAHFSIRRTAERLVDKGFCVVRFDYDGTGDSSGEAADPDRVAAWLSSIDAAIRLLRDAGVSWIALSGMRSGALMASVAAEKDSSIEALALVDPVPSGRAFVSEQRAMAAMAIGVKGRRDDGSVETPGVVYDSATVDAFKTLRIGSDDSMPAPKMLVMTRRGTTPDSGLAARLSSDSVTWAEATGQEELVDAEAPDQRLPYDDIERVVGWISETGPTETVAVKVPKRAGAAPVAEGPDGRQVVERPIFLGTTGLFGMVTEVPGRVSGPAVVFFNVATEPHTGPARLWVQLSRRWAALGLRCVRVDMSGLGDSPTRPGEPEFVIRLPVNFDDVAEAVKAVSPEDPSDVVLAGLCSSAYQALDSAMELNPRGVIALNPVLTFQPPEMIANDEVYPRRRVALPRGNVIEKFHHDGPLAPLRRRFPNLGWRIRTLIARGARPSAWIKELTGSGVDLLLICGDREARPIRNGTTPRSMSKLVRTGLFKFEYIPGLQHGLLVAAHRDRIEEIVTSHVTERFCGGGRSGSRDRTGATSSQLAIVLPES